jgi:hypothetical protein
MLKKWMRYVCLVLCACMGQAAHAGNFFNVTATGPSTPIEVALSLCLNGRRPLSCQVYKVFASNLSISTTIPNHTYPNAGIKVLTSGYQFESDTPNANGYVLFSVSNTAPQAIAFAKTGTPYSLGGAVSGLTGAVVLENNGSDPISTSTNGNFTFSTHLATGNAYHVTVQTQPVNQTCTVNNGSGKIGNADVNNVTVTCSTNAYTVGGTVSGLSGTVVLQNNSSNATSVTTNGSYTFPPLWLGEVLMM